MCNVKRPINIAYCRQHAIAKPMSNARLRQTIIAPSNLRQRFRTSDVWARIASKELHLPSALEAFFDVAVALATNLRRRGWATRRVEPPFFVFHPIIATAILQLAGNSHAPVE